MRIGFISDLHIDVNPTYHKKDFLMALYQASSERDLDMLVIGGDIANEWSIVVSFVEQLQTYLSIPVYFIPGNHDFWQIDEPNKITWQIYDKYLEHPQSLLEKNLVLSDEMTLVAHTGWYNYAVHADRFTTEELEIGKYRHGTWQDKVNIDWQMSDKKLSKRFASKVDNQLQQLETPKAILLTHVVNCPKFTVPMPHKVFDFFNAYLATDDFLPLIEQYPISHSIMGHIHYRLVKEMNDVTYVINSLGYKREWRTPDLLQEVRSALFVLII